MERLISFGVYLVFPAIRPSYGGILLPFKLQFHVAVPIFPSWRDARVILLSRKLQPDYFGNAHPLGETQITCPPCSPDFFEEGSAYPALLPPQVPSAAVGL